MTTHAEIDQALRQLGTVEPPPGLEQRIQRGLHSAPRRFSLSVIYAVSGAGLAASVAVFAVALNPALRRFVFPQTGPETYTRRVAPAASGFGAAGAVRVPVEPVPVEPTPINQGRGRSRSGRTLLPAGSVAPLPRGVAPTQPLAHTGTPGR